MNEPRTARTGGTDTVLDDRVVEELRSRLRGELLRPRGAGYEVSRKVWNGSISRFPALIARCAGVADVLESVNFARENGLPMAVRSGGHSFPGLLVCDYGSK